ncbi:hypothetical protein DXC26_14910 [Clostridiaceae bacterium OM08-6BH]|nr:hypothetical protein DXC26_14910 [Clostridiaceae bacterium OM08-6BH]
MHEKKAKAPHAQLVSVKIKSFKKVYDAIFTHEDNRKRKHTGINIISTIEISFDFIICLLFF